MVGVLCRNAEPVVRTVRHQAGRIHFSRVLVAEPHGVGARHRVGDRRVQHRPRRPRRPPALRAQPLPAQQSHLLRIPHPPAHHPHDGHVRRQPSSPRQNHSGEKIYSAVEQKLLKLWNLNFIKI